jgi:uncharacterized protein (TIGR02246 family)
MRRLGAGLRGQSISSGGVTAEEAARTLYQRLIDGRNEHDADAMAAAVAPDGLVIGFDGSQMPGRAAVSAELGGIFADHETATYVVKVRSVLALGGDVALLHAVAGMVPPGGSELMPDRNQIQTVVARQEGGDWLVGLFQTTPARFNGRPELSEALTAELSEQLTAQA